MRKKMNRKSDEFSIAHKSERERERERERENVGEENGCGTVVK